MDDGLTIQLSREFRVSQRREGLGDLRRFDVGVVDDESLEERLVPLAPQVPGRGQVGVLAVGQQVERLVQRVLDIGEGCLGDFELPLGLVGLGGQPVLLLTQQVDWHRPRVIGVKELLALLGQLGDGGDADGWDSDSACVRIPARALFSFSRTAFACLRGIRTSP